MWIWIVLSLISLVLLITHLSFIIIQYRKFETTTQVNLTTYRKLEFPGKLNYDDPIKQSSTAKFDSILIAF